MDPLRNAHALPDDIRDTLDRLVVDRRGDNPGSHMFTEDIIGHVAPGACYRLETDRLTPWDDAVARPTPSPKSSGPPPPHVRICGHWSRTEEVASAKANILGGLGILTLPDATLAIPQAPTTAAALAFYGARLLAVGDAVEFEADQNLPVTVMNIGPAYVADYLQVAGRGGGSFIEYHDRPHLHMPLEEGATGHILLGRAESDEYLLSAFRIPQGHAIYTAPYALHADPYLVGRYLVVYSVTRVYSTVVFRTDDGEIVNTRIVTP